MNCSSILLLPVLLAFTLNGDGPTPTPAPTSAQTLYYWYSVPDDAYNDRATTNDEIQEMWLYYGTLVDTNPAGGTLIERGYYSNAYPHTGFPLVFLYAHF